MQKRNIEVVIQEKHIDRQYCPIEGVYVGKMLICKYGWNYRLSKDSEYKYAIESDIIPIKKEFTTFKTIEEAKEMAYKVIDIYLERLVIEL